MLKTSQFRKSVSNRMSIDLSIIKCVLVYTLFIVNFHLYSQDCYKMKCICVSAQNIDSVQIKNKYLGKIIEVSNDVKCKSNSVAYTIGDRVYNCRRSETLFEWKGVNYWECFDVAKFSKDYSCLEITECRPCGEDIMIICSYYVTNLNAETCNSYEQVSSGGM